MKPFQEKKFDIPALTGISAKTIEEHLKLYAGYVKNSNMIRDKIADLLKDKEANAYVLGELWRRFSFEYNGMRNHEVYFSSLVGGAKPLPAGSTLKKQIEAQWGDFSAAMEVFKSFAATTRGIGWAVLWYDRAAGQLITGWIDEQHLGLLQDCTMVLGLDMWEHSYVADYAPSGKKKYIEDFFANLNWERIEKNFVEAK